MRGFGLTGLWVLLRVVLVRQGELARHLDVKQVPAAAAGGRTKSGPESHASSGTAVCRHNTLMKQGSQPARERARRALGRCWARAAPGAGAHSFSSRMSCSSRVADSLMRLRRLNTWSVLSLTCRGRGAR